MKNSKMIAAYIVAACMAWPLQYAVADADHDHDHHEHDHGEEGKIHMPLESQKLGGIEAMPAASAPAVKNISVSGRIAQDVDAVTHVRPEKTGVIKEAGVRLGHTVKAGDVLCIMTVSDGGSVEVKAPTAGVVIAEFAKAGERVDTMDALYTIADMSKLPVNFDVHAADLPFIKLGQTINVHTMASSGQGQAAKIVFISPRVDEATYTTKIKAMVDNSTQGLKLGMPVRGEIEAGGEGSRLNIPPDAIQNIEGEDVVFIQINEENFEKRDVEDIKEGDKVVVKGAFILKSKMLESEMGHDHSH